jgi:hypothetical protein
VEAMRRSVWSPLLSVIAVPLAAAADPVCCKLFGIDLTRVLGSDAAVCGKIVDGDDRADAQHASVEERKRATQCALEAQRQRRPFVYTYRLLAPPDMDLVNQAVFGAHGERMLMKLGVFARQNIRTIEICESLTVLPDGKLKGTGCYETYP